MKAYDGARFDLDSYNLLDQGDIVTLEQNPTWEGPSGTAGMVWDCRTNLPSWLGLLDEDFCSLVHHQVHEFIEALLGRLMSNDISDTMSRGDEEGVKADVRPMPMSARLQLEDGKGG
jgi:hypothetical protein